MFPGLVPGSCDIMHIKYLVHRKYSINIRNNSFSYKLKNWKVITLNTSPLPPWYKNLPLRLEIPGREIGLSWVAFSLLSPGDCGDFGNAEGFDVKLCTCSVINTHGFSIIESETKLNQFWRSPFRAIAYVLNLRDCSEN